MICPALCRWLRHDLPRHCLTLLLACAACPVPADPVENLRAAGLLEVATSVVSTQPLVPGQKAALVVEIATQGWFWGGTRIGLPEVSGLVILQTEQFATNASESRNGRSWVLQRWTLDVYPQRAGDFTIPPLQLQLKVNVGGGNVQGRLSTRSNALHVVLPQALEQAQQWVAAPHFEVSQSFDRPLEGLAAGDAFERQIVFQASDVMAMMLPTFTPAQHSGLAAYPDPPALQNSTNRGQSEARRSQRITYVVEAPGRYELAGREYFWWDTSRARLQLLSLPAVAFTVAGAPESQTRTGLALSGRLVLLVATALLLLAGAALAARKWLPKLPVSRVRARLASVWQTLQALRRPALPARLNPDSSAGG